MDTFLLLQPNETTGSGKSPQEVILEIVTGILERKEIPPLLDISNGNKSLFERN